MKIKRNTKRLEEIITNAVNIKLYDADNYYEGEVLSMINSVEQFLRNEINQSKDTYIYDNGNGSYTLHKHQNRWFKFQSI